MSTPTPGQLWTDPSGQRWMVIDRDGAPWLARPAADADLTGWRLAAEADGDQPAPTPRSAAAEAVGDSPWLTALRDHPHRWSQLRAVRRVIDPINGDTGTERIFLDLDMLERFRAAQDAADRLAEAVDIRYRSDSDEPHAICPHCRAVDLIGEQDAQGRVNPVVFGNNVDTDGVHFTVVSTHRHDPAQRYLCRACTGTVTIPPDITFGG